MPSFNTLCGTIHINPVYVGKTVAEFEARFEPYPMATFWLVESGDTEEEALGELVEQLSNIAVEARNAIHEYNKNKAKHPKRYAGKEAKAQRKNADKARRSK